MIKLTNLTKLYGKLTAVDSINLEVAQGEVFGFLGPNGAGKTTTIRMMAGLLQPTSGSALIGGYDVLREPLKAKFITGFIPDRPFLYEKLTATEFMHFVSRLYDMENANKEISGLLSLFGLKEWADELVENFSHGMKQRLVMASALLHKPQVLIVDEPTTGLDAYVQNRILGMLSDLRKAGGTLLYVTHDLTVASQICDRLYIMYAGRIMETGKTRKVLQDSLHPYTRTLIASVPQGYEDSPPLPVQLGEPPNLARLPDGCKFNPRCPYAKDVCQREEPPLFEVLPGRQAACWKVDGANGKYPRD
jgi:ABC-2 type transport system ATP-binding protein